MSLSLLGRLFLSLPVAGSDLLAASEWRCVPALLLTVLRSFSLQPALGPSLIRVSHALRLIAAVASCCLS